MRNVTAGIILFFAVAGCRSIGGKQVRGNGVTGTERRQTGSFHSITVRGSLSLVVAPGSVHSVKVEGDENLLRYVEVRQHGDELEVRPRNGYSLHPDAGLKVVASAPGFSRLEVAGSGNIRSASRITGDDKLRVDIHGSGDVRLDVDAPEVETGIAGSGSIKINGTTRNFSVNISGSGEVYGFNLLSEYTRVHIAGSGDAEVFASKKLDVTINGAGDVAYKGTASVNQQIHGSGDVRRK
jgi:hypothetical protein